MEHKEDRIKPDDSSIGLFIEQLRKNYYQIPTFQREFEWKRKDIKALWDSIYKFYPIGSLLIWNTDIKLHAHRKIGSLTLSEDELDSSEYRYILDGQQRATSLLASYEGDKIKDGDGKDLTLYFDLSDKEGEFVFKEEAKWREASDHIIVKVKDVVPRFKEISKGLQEKDLIDSHEYDNLTDLNRCLTNYKIMFVLLRGIKVQEVCDIFERINQLGKKLDIVDILVAKTYRTKGENPNRPEQFYLRDFLQKFKSGLDYTYSTIDELLIMQMVAKHIEIEIPNSDIDGITSANLNKIKAEYIEDVWDNSTKAIKDTITVFHNNLNLKGPEIIPYNYLYIPLAYHFYDNNEPDYEFAKQWFWRTCFGDTYRTSTQVDDYCYMFADLENGKKVKIKRLVVDKSQLRAAEYSSRDAFSRAILAFMAYLGPKDFRDYDAEVLQNVYLTLGTKPNLHHIYPYKFLKDKWINDKIDYSPDSLMNICYLTQDTNIKISDTSPLKYFKGYEKKNKKLKKCLDSHLIPRKILNQTEYTDGDYDEFIDDRTDYFIKKLKATLSKVKVKVIDSDLE